MEALRFGVVPTLDVSALTIGYKEIETWVLKCLNKARSNTPSFGEIEGAFGTGKSHTMSVARHIARQNNFVTASVEVDGVGVSLSDPRRLLMHVMQSIELPDLHSSTPLVDIHTKVIRLADRAASRELESFDKVFSNYRTIRSLVEEDSLDQWCELLEAILTGSDEITASDLRKRISQDFYHRGLSTWGASGTFIHPKRLIGTARRDRGIDFSEALVAYSILARHAGYAGLLLTIDEFEVESFLSRAKHQDMVDVVHALGNYLRGEQALFQAPLAVLIATTAEDDNYGDGIVDSLRQFTDGELKQLRAPTNATLQKLAKNIEGAYGTSYGIKSELDTSLFTAVSANLDNSDIAGSGRIRAFIKRYMFELDSRFGPPIE